MKTNPSANSNVSCTPTGGHLAKRFGVYVHIPFCVHRCSYCDFFSMTQYQGSDFEKLADKICWELAEGAKVVKTGKKVDTIFIGGGTPSLMPVPLIEKILNSVYGNFEVSSQAEITMEANPETVIPELALALSRTKINRISLGAQSFDEPSLQKLERLGNEASVRRAAGELRAAGFENFNLDLIFGIPGQTEATMLSNIVKAADVGPKHISFYQLTLKEGHTLFRSLPQDEISASLYERGIEKLAELGYGLYEISNFAKPGFDCRHNLLYWDGSDFLGVGPSASSRFFWNGTFHHRKQYSDLKKYLESESFLSVPFEGTTTSQTLLEAVFLELRKKDGIHLKQFEERYGLDLTSAKNYTLLRKQNMLEESFPFVTLTSKGRLLADSIANFLL